MDYTIAIITTGGIANDISKRFGISPQKTASILDTFSCFIQGLIPYGAQILMAAGLFGISPVSIVPVLYYPMIMGLFAVLSIAFDYTRRKNAEIIPNIHFSHQLAENRKFEQFINRCVQVNASLLYQLYGQDSFKHFPHSLDNHK